jgi:arginine/lysine/ornithine decarboxylase
VKDAYHLLNTTSPSPLLLADVESCVKAFREQGESLIDAAIARNNRIRERLARLP